MFINEIMEFQLKSIKCMERELFILSVGGLRDLFITLPRVAEENYSVPVRMFSSLTETVTGYCESCTSAPTFLVY